MKHFKFKLQAVLTLRQRAEQVALGKYSRAIQKRQEAFDRLADAQLALNEARRSWLDALAKGCPAARAAQVLAYCQSLETCQTQREQGLHAADLELNETSQQMLLARQHREAVERYLARQRELYDREVRREEIKLSDELASRRSPVSFSGRCVAETVLN